MTTLLFILFVGILVLVFIGSFIFSHMPPKRYTAGWWAGVILAFICIASSQVYFQELPMTSHTVISGCSASVEEEIDWAPIISDATRVDWGGLVVGLILGIIGFEIIDRLMFVSDKVIAFILLFLAFTSLGLLVYVFLIRKFTYMIFSFVMGVFLSLFLHIAFISRLFEKDGK